ncbi:MAG TPA: carbohydrate ABC transporter permease [bacterium]|nr:carbohydrate ABC transporter permease [bacterium]
MRPWARVFRRGWVYLVVVPLLVIFLFPYLWLLSGAFKSAREVFAVPPHLIPLHPTLANFSDVLQRPVIRRFFLNSIVITAITLVVNLMLGSAAAFALSIYQFRGRRTIVLATLATQLFPAVIIVIPLYRTWGALGLLNSLQALIITYIAYTLPLAVWMLTGYMRTIPFEIVSAALVDGASRAQLYWRIVMPLALPGLAATAVYVSLVTWNEFIFALTLTTTDEVRTVTVGLYSFIGEFVYNWNLLLAMAVLMALPITALFLCLQRFLVQGLTAGATKG